MCVESHCREFLELGFEVAVVRDAIAAPKIPEGDGYLSALINFRYMANGLWTTEETVSMLRA
jgi:nicotinamidase-related amidase